MTASDTSLLETQQPPNLPQDAEIEDLTKECKKLTLWRSPLQTMYYFGWQLFDQLCRAYEFLKDNKLVISLVSFVLIVIILVLNVPGPQHKYLDGLNRKILWCLWWIGLGILSSVGLGTGLHTFLLYLGPHIATVTMAAWECQSTAFPEPPYPDTVICPAPGSPSMSISLWVIMNKVRLESIMWGIGTAIGELPPYVMARAARLSGEEIEDVEFNDLQRIKDLESEELGCSAKIKLRMQNLVQKAGFFGILLCASVPNPLFDLAGVTCGYLLIPFSTFFPATLLGKAIFKTHLQMISVIIIFTADNLAALEDWLASIAVIGPLLHDPFQEYMEQQKLTLHGSSPDQIKHSATLLSIIFNCFIGLMILFFLISIIHGMAQHKYRKHNERYFMLLPEMEDSDLEMSRN